MATLHRPPSTVRKAYYRNLEPMHLSPLWEVLHELVPAHPSGTCAPYCWRYHDVRPCLMQSAELISASEAQRRVLILENPALKGSSRITTSLYAGLQLLMPGELAPSHQHSQSALRFVLEGSSAYTSVDGEPATMRRGDLILTPAWKWHDHANEGTSPAVWLDGLDIPIVAQFAAGFCEQGSVVHQDLVRPEGDARARFGANMLPADWRADSPSSPVFTYPYERSRAALETLRKADRWDPCNGIQLKYANPATGGHVLPTMAAFLQLLPRGMRTEAYRSTDATVFVCVEGTGRLELESGSFAWGASDVFVVPSWEQRRFTADSDAVLFSYSDRAAQEKLGLWRECRDGN